MLESLYELETSPNTNSVTNKNGNKVKHKILTILQLDIWTDVMKLMGRAFHTRATRQARSARLEK